MIFGYYFWWNLDVIDVVENGVWVIDRRRYARDFAVLRRDIFGYFYYFYIIM